MLFPRRWSRKDKARVVIDIALGDQRVVSMIKAVAESSSCSSSLGCDPIGDRLPLPARSSSFVAGSVGFAQAARATAWPRSSPGSRCSTHGHRRPVPTQPPAVLIIGGHRRGRIDRNPPYSEAKCASCLPMKPWLFSNSGVGVLYFRAVGSSSPVNSAGSGFSPQLGRPSS